MDELERQTREKKLYDPVKAKAQIQVYKDIYNLDADKANQIEQDGALRILQSASKDDKEAIAKYFEIQIKKGKNQSQIDEEMEKLQMEINALEDVTSSHQGFKFYRTAMTKDSFEDALIELREKEFEKKFQSDKEQMVGNSYKTV